jgi:putative oxidoreductase
MSEPRPLIPALKPFYDFVVPLTWPMVRIAVGWNLFVHAYLKIMRGPMNTAPAFKQMGFTPEWIYVYGSLAVELGGVCIMLGLFTRFFAAAAAIEMGVIFCAYWTTGFSWLARGYEYVLLWGLLCFIIALRGGGPYSLDRKIGVEL